MNATATSAVVTPFTQNNNKQQKQTAKEVIAANVQALIEQLEQGHSEPLTAYLTAMGRFHNYSFGNILEIARQKPDATRVAGLYAWNQLGRKVKKGEHGIRILAPVIGVRRKNDEEAEKDIRTQNQAVLVGFRAAYVFDVLSRDLRPRFYAPMERAMHPRHPAIATSHMIAQLSCPLQQLLAIAMCWHRSRVVPTSATCRSLR